MEYDTLFKQYGYEYLKIVKHNSLKSRFRDNEGNIYTLENYLPPESPMFSKVVAEITPIDTRNLLDAPMYYINTHNPLPWSIYKRTNNYDYELEKLTGQKEYFGCLKEFYTHDARKIVDELTTSDDNWVSSIRKKILNMNTDSFSGGKKKRKRTIKNRKRKMKKTNKKR